jgi:hypothetical protein
MRTNASRASKKRRSKVVARSDCEFHFQPSVLLGACMQASRLYRMGKKATTQPNCVGEDGLIERKRKCAAWKRRTKGFDQVDKSLDSTSAAEGDG